MGQSGSFQMMYGWRLSERECEEYEQSEGPIYELVAQGHLEDEVGGNPQYDWAEWVVGKTIGPWMMELGAMEVEDDYGELAKAIREELKPHIEFFGREPRKILVMSYG